MHSFIITIHHRNNFWNPRKTQQYSSNWKSETLIRSEEDILMKPYKTDSHNNIKTQAFNDMVYNEIMITNGDGTKYHVMGNWKSEGVNQNFDNLLSVFSGDTGYDYLWANNMAYKGPSDSMWANKFWALNNQEKDNDRCHDGRINVCRQSNAAAVGELNHC